MGDNRSGRVNALVCAILDANGDSKRLAEQMRFFSDLTDQDVDRALSLAHWAKTDGSKLLFAQWLKPLGGVMPADERIPA